MRRKNDTLIKYFQLANTMFLTNEEFGALVRKIMIEDDKNGIRYENIDEETKEDLKAINDISAYAQTDAIKSKVRAVKQGLQDEIFCKYCGKEIEEDSIYCKYCGEKVR